MISGGLTKNNQVTVAGLPMIGVRLTMFPPEFHGTL